MKLISYSAAAFILSLLLNSACGETVLSKRSSPNQQADAQAFKGNGAPSGSHFNLNLIGVAKDKTADMTGNSGHRIFVPLEGRSRILLGEGDFQVLDANGTDGSASFQLPMPDANGDGITEYSVFARALGKPGGNSKLTSCATDPTTGEEVCSLNSLVSVRTKGKSSFSNVSKELLTVSVDLDGDGRVESIPLFDDRLEDFFWSYDNNGLKLLQLRFYDAQTAINQL